MPKNLQLLLELEELALFRRGLSLLGPGLEDADLDYLDQRIQKLRRKLPGELLSRYDRLFRRYSDAVAVVSDGVCQGCHGELSPRLGARLAAAREPLECEHCGRFIFAEQNAPPYIASA